MNRELKKCPCCDKEWPEDCEQAICIEMHNECCTCRFTPQGHGSQSGTADELLIITDAQQRRASKANNNQILAIKTTTTEPSISELISRIEQLEKQVAELNSRTMGQQLIGHGSLPENNLPAPDLLANWPDWKRDYKLTENS